MGDEITRARRGVRDGNDRIARIGRWLATPPVSADVVALVLSVHGNANDEPEIVGRWERKLVTVELAHHLNALICDAANDRATTISATLAWVRADDTVYLSKGFRAVCDDSEKEHVRPLDGSMLSMLAQEQRHNEAFASQLALMSARQDERWERVLGLYERTIETLSARLAATDAALSEARDREERALELAEQATDAAAEADKAAQTASQGDPLGQVIDLAAKQLLAGGSK